MKKNINEWKNEWIWNKRHIIALYNFNCHFIGKGVPRPREARMQDPGGTAETGSIQTEVRWEATVRQISDSTSSTESGDGLLDGVQYGYGPAVRVLHQR